jgi:ribose 5-phosphate isomerase A
MLDGDLFVTDQKAMIYDLDFGRIDAPAELSRWLDSIPGVIRHGLFLDQIYSVVPADG